MSEKNIVRKIAVIFVTDVVGFSKLMEVNEEQHAAIDKLVDVHMSVQVFHTCTCVCIPVV